VNKLRDAKNENVKMWRTLEWQAVVRHDTTRVVEKRQVAQMVAMVGW
jgi:hypothetical protein